MVTQSLSYMPLSEGFFFKWHGQSDHSFMASSSYRLREVVPLWSLKSIWHTNGSLLISYSHVNNRYVHIPDPKTSGRELVLAPFGWLAKIDMKSIPDSSSLLGSMAESKLDRDIQWRSQCGHVLQQYGLALTGDVEWVLVSIFPNHPGEVSNVLEWPKELCYVMTDSIYDQNQGNRREQLNTYFWKDPLVEADTWFKDRKARESLIKEQLQARSKTHDHDKPQGQEEVLPHLQSKYDELIDQQILAGIYPTPPDASKTHTNIRSDGSPRVPECSEDSDIMDLKDELAEYATPALDGSIDVANYNPLKDDELFADMDGDIDGDNGVTEDDFRFFDEPDGPCITAIESTLPDLMDFREPGDEHQASKEELLDDLRGSLINHSLNTIVDEQAEQEITKPSHTRIVQIVSSPMRHIYEKVSEIPCKLNSVQVRYPLLTPNPEFISTDSS